MEKQEVVDNDIQKILDEYNNIEKNLKDKLAGMRIPDDANVPLIPEGGGNFVVMKGKIPRLGDLTKAADVQIGILHSYFTDWSVYLHFCEDTTTRIWKIRKKKMSAILQPLKKHLKQVLKVKTTDLTMEMETFKRKGDEIPLFVQLDSSVLEAELLKDTVSNRYKDYKSIAHAISREQSRRSSDIKSGSRAFNISKSPPSGDSRW